MAVHNVGSATALLKDGEMTRLELEGNPVVIAHVGGRYYAFGGNCTHYGAPLNEGVLKGHTLMCPWHHACFDIVSGVRLEPPALNDLPRYTVEIEGDNILVTLPHENDQEPQGKIDGSDDRVFVIVGGGAAGNSAAEELRRVGFKGRVIIVSDVPEVPVDRPNLSKDYLDGHAQPEWIPLRDENWYAARDIELRLNTRVQSIDLQAKTVMVDVGEPLHYDKLLLATGGKPRQLTNLPGTDLKGVYTLRTLDDSTRIIEAAEQGKRAVIIGASFIGMEVASSLGGGRGVSVTVVEMSPVPFARVFGEDIGRMFQQLHEEKGVQFRLGAKINRLLGENGYVTGVELGDGEVLPADFVVVGVGVSPATDFLNGSGLQLEEKDRSVRVNASLRTSEHDIYAAGDIARWEDGTAAGTRIEHWRVAQQHGIIAARNMLGGAEDANNHVPFFWTTQWGTTLNYVGHANQWDEIIYRGSPQDRNFIAFYVVEGQMKAAASVGFDHDAEMDAIEFILRDQMPLSTEQMRDTQFDLVAYSKLHALT
jgi:apoptosis-inducing factor 3